MNKKRWIILSVVLILLIGGGVIMTQIETPFDIFLTKDFTGKKEKQIEFLKEHEDEMTDYIKNDEVKGSEKVSTVLYHWQSVDNEVIGNGTPTGGGNILTIRISVYDSKQKEINEFGFAVEPDDIKKPTKIIKMYTINANYDYYQSEAK